MLTLLCLGGSILDGKEILDTAEKYIARTDVDRPLLLFMINTNTRAAFRANQIFRLQTQKQFSVVNGFASCPSLKSERFVRWHDGNVFRPITKIADIKQLYEMYADPEITGTPAHYNVQGQSVQIVPAPDSGTLYIAGEFWPVELTDSESSTNIFSDEIPDFLVNYGVAEYLDFLQEENRAQAYRQKALIVLEQWLKENKRQEFSNLHNMPRDPLGNFGFNRRTKPITSSGVSSGDTEIIDDPGVW